jgi:hypothetical protein
MNLRSHGSPGRPAKALHVSYALFVRLPAAIVTRTWPMADTRVPVVEFHC